MRDFDDFLNTHVIDNPYDARLAWNAALRSVKSYEPAAWLVTSKDGSETVWKTKDGFANCTYEPLYMIPEEA